MYIHIYIYVLLIIDPIVSLLTILCTPQEMYACWCRIYVYTPHYILGINIHMWAISNTLGSRNGPPQIWKGLHSTYRRICLYMYMWIYIYIDCSHQPTKTNQKHRCQLCQSYNPKRSYSGCPRLDPLWWRDCFGDELNIFDKRRTSTVYIIAFYINIQLFINPQKSANNIFRSSPERFLESNLETAQPWQSKSDVYSVKIRYDNAIHVKANFMMVGPIWLVPMDVHSCGILYSCWQGLQEA